jgi:hypothetical protein
VRRTYIKNKVLIDWYGDEILKQLERGKEHSERATAERVYRHAVNNAKPGSYRRSYRQFYVNRAGHMMRMKPWMQRIPGRLKSSIVKLVSKFQQGGYIVMAGNFLAYYARIVEYGTKARRQKTTGRFTGSQRKGSRYMRKAIGQEKRFLLNQIRLQVSQLRGMNS